MRTWPKILLVWASLVFFGTASSSATAKTAGYCLECHSQKLIQKFDRSILAGGRSVYHAKLEPCPGVRSLSEEIFFTETRITKLNQILHEIDQRGWASHTLRKNVSETAESFSALKGSKKASIAQFTQESSALRGLLQKVYDHTLQARDESARRWLIGLASLIFLGVLVLLRVGHRKLNRMGKTLFLSLLVAGSLSLNACSSGPAEPAKKSPAQERLEQSLHVASQSSGKMEETFYQSFLLAEMARQWSKIETIPAEKAFHLAWQMALRAREKAAPIKDLKEVVSRWPNQAEALKEKVNFDSVLDLGDELRNADGRTWALRAVAEEWIQVNRQKGRAALEFAFQEALKIHDAEIRDRELKSIAGAWAGIDEDRALQASRSIVDPFLKALALMDAALSIREKGKASDLFAEALQVAESAPPSYSQSKAFIQISAAAARTDPEKRNAWAGRTLAKIQSLDNPQLKAYAILELILHWAPLDREQAERWAVEIPSLFPEARAYSFFFLARNAAGKARALAHLKNALAEASKVVDPFEAQKIKSLIALSLAGIESGEAWRILPQVEDPYLRSEILAELALEFSKQDKRKALDLAEKIPLEPFRTKMIVRIITQWVPKDQEKITSLYHQIIRVASSISDPYTRAMILIELGKGWESLDRRKQTSLLEQALRSAEEISSLRLKAEVLEAVAGGWKVSDPAKAQKILEGIDSSVIRARKSLEEIRLWAKADPEKALPWAEAFPSLFPLERAMALKEVAERIKKTQPLLAFDILAEAMAQILILSAEPKEGKLLSQLVVEAALLDKERTLRWLQQISDRETRDLLLREAGSTWAREDPLWALKAAREMSESALRFSLYRKIAEAEVKKLSSSRLDRRNQPVLLALSQWGLGREKASKEGFRAGPFFETAWQEIEKIADRRERSFLLSGLAPDWAFVDEGKALAVAEKIPSDFPEPLSYALLQVGAQLRKWNRKEADGVFQRTLSATAQIPNPALKAQRLLQLAQQWQLLDRKKGKEVLKKAEREARKIISPPTMGGKILTEILLAQANLDPAEVLSIARNAGQPSTQAKVLLESAKVLKKGHLEENIRILEKARQFALQGKNQRLTSAIAIAWFSVDPDKSLEVLAQVESRKIRIEALRQMARLAASLRKGEARRLLEQASQETLGIEGLTEKVMYLSEIAADWMETDKERARATYLQAYQIVEKAESSSPKF